MRTGISTASLFMRQYNEDAVQTINRLGVKTCEIFLETFSEYTRAYGELLNERKGDLSVNSVHLFTTNLEPQLFSENERTRKDAFNFLGEAMNAANAFGAKYYTFHGTARYKKNSRSGLNDNFPKIGAALEGTRRLCEKYGVALSLETVEWSTYNRPGEILSAPFRHVRYQTDAYFGLSRKRISQRNGGAYFARARIRYRFLRQNLPAGQGNV